MEQSQITLSRLVEESFGYLETEFEFRGREEGSQPFHYAFSAPHLKVSIWYGRWELDIVLEREIHTRVLRPFHPTSYDLWRLVQRQVPELADEIVSASFSNTTEPTEADISRALKFWGKALRDHYAPLLRKDFKALEQYMLANQA